MSDTLVIGVSLIRLGGAFFAWLAGLALVVVGALWMWVAHTAHERLEDAARP
jgi:hypothetical protein